MVVSSTYLRLLIFLLAALIAVYASSSLTFEMMYSAYKLNKQISIYSIDVLLSPLLTSLCSISGLPVVSWPVYRFHRMQVRWSGICIVLRIFCSLLWSTQSMALTLSMKQKQMFIWNSLAFSMIQQMLAVWSLVPLPFLNPAWTSGSSGFTYCWSLAYRILSDTLLACEMRVIVQ